ncbi:hypothetical protein EN828_17780 [Mesorhizobium sp. M2D.F.Ca.ET.185.01.1.1]|uniref:hypothetical protein n=1 Tax=unclassified Mesorhizobium TaxID=325217 RepID=UPI000FCC6152|nr:MULTISPECIES: hypothetical protein [unclassified Mesorhizobium]TGP79289.1 hypothetical protein EN870_14100 [bacterium M00.F.Ca.ET.227.01.1.1]TGQ00973.1 hypothetical protein EN864_03135 [bacterium M00.F.Ca.ET.221.01.1.1]TGQ02508.1 hypothetical protein EN865_00770 [bacterium M00.F.Ca.ET.222.01.1.1]TGU12403.1 hypothetical protein EN806_18530 [bacterium M00.F.Ca.ET.163.01.1.1]TGU34374.1 hypothetical protein EN799_20665 [bacterium M00.F.Ca.ET.156.01.1.1]TGU46337.1 hypothetical protein EN789_154
MPLKATAHVEAMSAFALANEDILLLAERAGEMLADIKAAWHAAAAPKSYSSWREESWVWMRLSGPRLAEAMSALCALDMRPQKLGADDIAQTRVGHIEAMMFYSPAGFDILFDIAASAYFARAVAAVARHTA